MFLFFFIPFLFPFFLIPPPLPFPSSLLFLFVQCHLPFSLFASLLLFSFNLFFFNLIHLSPLSCYYLLYPSYPLFSSLSYPIPSLPFSLPTNTERTPDKKPHTFFFHPILDNGLIFPHALTWMPLDDHPSLPSPVVFSPPLASPLFPSLPLAPDAFHSSQGCVGGRGGRGVFN